jgi:hypothetical protein
MIDIKELRIGNLLNHNNGSMVGSFILGLIHLEDIIKDNSHAREYEPILLTEEWLLKFGFEKDDVFDKFFTYLPIHDLCMDKLSFRVDEGFICYESIKYRTLLKHIQYVHSLQNLYFALTNQELEIKK